MNRLSSTYRLAASVLVCAFALTAAAPIAVHLCAAMPGMAHGAMHASDRTEAAEEAMASHAAMGHDAPMPMAAPSPSDTLPGHACCGDDCPHTASMPDQASAHGDLPCCFVAPAAAADAVAVAPVPVVQPELLLATLPAASDGAELDRVQTPAAPTDTGPPPHPLRLHLVHAVLLI